MSAVGQLTGECLLCEIIGRGPMRYGPLGDEEGPFETTTDLQCGPPLNVRAFLLRQEGLALPRLVPLAEHQKAHEHESVAVLRARRWHWPHQVFRNRIAVHLQGLRRERR